MIEKYLKKEIINRALPVYKSNKSFCLFHTSHSFIILSSSSFVAYTNDIWILVLHQHAQISKYAWTSTQQNFVEISPILAYPSTRTLTWRNLAQLRNAIPTIILWIYDFTVGYEKYRNIYQILTIKTALSTHYILIFEGTVNIFASHYLTEIGKKVESIQFLIECEIT